MPLHCGLSGPGVELGVPGPPALRQSRWVAVTADHFTPGARGPAALLRALWFCQLLERTASPQEGRSDLASTVTQHRGCLSSWKSCLRDLRATVRPGWWWGGGGGPGGSAGTWLPACWPSHLEPKRPLGQSPLPGSKAMLDLQGNFSFEDLSSWLPSSPARSPSPAVPLRVVPTLSTTDMKTAGERCSGPGVWRGGVVVGAALASSCQERAVFLRTGRFGEVFVWLYFFTNRPASISSFTMKISLRI